jgi:hypothetical protein
VAHPVAWYREFVPCKALQAHVYAIFTFVPGLTPPPPHRPLLRAVAFADATFCSPQFADGHVSMVFELGRTCDANCRWFHDSSGLRGTVIGPMSGVGRTEGGDRPEMVGAYFRPAISRQHLSREFREHIGVSPKLYSELARFQSGLVYAGRRTSIDWAGAAIDMGYADQSHMIAEFRRFSGLTPQTLANRAWFHPFIERARSAAWWDNG